MATLRELIDAIQRRPGVQAVLIVGADGLVIEAQDAAKESTEALAAHAPAVLSAARQLGQSAQAGEPRLALVELERGYAVLLELTEGALLLVTTARDAPLAELLYDLRRHRGAMSALVA